MKKEDYEFMTGQMEGLQKEINALMDSGDFSMMYAREKIMNIEKVLIDYNKKITEEYTTPKIQEMDDHITDAIEHKDFEIAYDDGKEGNDCADDGNIHINKGKYRFVFYRGQGTNEYSEKDIPKFRRLIDATFNGLSLK